MKTYLCRAALALSILLLPAGNAEASGPVPRIMEACVVDGLIITVDGYWIKLMKTKRSINLAKYEGKRIKVSGNLYPGDWFSPKVKTLKVTGKCNVLKNKRFRRGWSWAHRSVARGLLGRRTRPSVSGHKK